MDETGVGATVTIRQRGYDDYVTALCERHRKEASASGFIVSRSYGDDEDDFINPCECCEAEITVEELMR